MSEKKISEEEFINYLEENSQDSDEVLSSKFKLSIDYIKSVKWRIKRQKASKEIPKLSKI